MSRADRKDKSRGGGAVVGLAFVALGLLGAVPALAARTDSAVHAPPATGQFAYNAFVPARAPGFSYVDPVFHETVRRLTTDHAHDDIYARNMWWSADETRYLHRTSNPDFWDVIDVATGTVTHTGIPNGGGFAADGGFDPVDPNVLYYLTGTDVHQVTLNPDGTFTDAIYFTPPGGAPLGDLGGKMNWLDASGRYMLVRYGAEPAVHLYDRTNFSAGPYANPIDATRSVGFGLGLSPDGQFVVGYDGRAVGYGGMGQGLSWRIDHVNRALPLTPNYFWGLCGNHGAFVSASDGRNYMAVSDCFSGTQLWRVDITNAVGDQSPGTGPDVDAQHAMPNNKLLASWPTPGEGAGHVSAVAAGPLRDWVFYATEDRDDTFDGGTGDPAGRITPWHAYRQEIMAINVMTGEIRRLAHHRSRLDDDYYSQPHVSASWKGAVVGFSSNFNQPGTQGEPPVTDVYAIPFVFPAPSLSSLSPVNVGGGPDGFVLTVSGRNFVSNSIVQWNGTNRTTSFVSSTELQATIPAADIATPGTAEVTVINPAPGGGTSNALTFTIQSVLSRHVVPRILWPST